MNKMARKIIELEEGWRESPYYDTEGYPTVGIGFKIGDKNDPLPKFVLPKPAGLAWLDYLIGNLEMNLASRLRGLSEARKSILISMAYQMGLNGLFYFEKTWDAIDNKDFNKAADEMLNSRWARQTPERANRHANVMRCGKVGAEPAYKDFG